jgi:hypothetical protein
MATSIEDMDFREITMAAATCARGYVKTCYGMFNGETDSLDRVMLSSTMVYFGLTILVYGFGLAYWSYGNSHTKILLAFPFGLGFIYTIVLSYWLIIRKKHLSKKLENIPAVTRDLTRPAIAGKCLILDQYLSVEFGQLNKEQLRLLIDKITDKIGCYSNERWWLERSTLRRFRGGEISLLAIGSFLLSASPIITWLFNIKLLIGYAIIIVMLAAWVIGATTISILLIRSVAWMSDNGNLVVYALWIMQQDIVSMLKAQ